MNSSTFLGVGTQPSGGARLHAEGSPSVHVKVNTNRNWEFFYYSGHISSGNWGPRQICVLQWRPLYKADLQETWNGIQPSWELPLAVGSCFLPSASVSP